MFLYHDIILQQSTHHRQLKLTIIDLNMNRGKNEVTKENTVSRQEIKNAKFIKELCSEIMCFQVHIAIK